MEQLYTRKEGELVRYVIIGNSTAAIAAVEKIRQLDKSGQIVIISQELHHTYSRPLISYLLLGKTDEQRMKYRDDSFYERNECKLLAGRRVVKINPDKKSLLLEDGSTIDYDKLLLATGSSAFVPPFKGLDTVVDKFTFMSLDDAHRLQRALSKEKKVLIIGAGLIGLKCAEGIIDKVDSVTVIDLAPRILSSILDEEGASLVEEHLKSKGIRFLLSTGVESFKGNNAQLSNKGTIEFDILVMAVGVRPNTGLMADIAAIDKGIIINSRSETTAKDIYAAGDCTQTIDASDGESKIMALLPNAYMQGECAGANMAGGSMSFDKAIPMNAIGFFGLHIITAGNYKGEEYIERIGGAYKRLFYSQDRLKGYILIKNIERAGIYTSLIREGTLLSSIDFSLICERPGLMAFTKEDRSQRLGGNDL